MIFIKEINQIFSHFKIHIKKIKLINLMKNAIPLTNYLIKMKENKNFKFNLHTIVKIFNLLIVFIQVLNSYLEIMWL